jgi:hypothetical protein
VISRLSDKLVSESFISDLISDHFAVVTVVRAHRPVVPMKSISFRSTSAIVLDRFESDIANIPFVVSPSDSLNDLLNQYNTGTRDVLDQHAPLKYRTFAVRPVNPWFSGEISQARRQMRKFERVWRRRRLEIDKEILLHHKNQLVRLVIDSKLTYFRTKITECGSDRKALYRLLDRCLIMKKVTRLPRHTSPLVLAYEFSLPGKDYKYQICYGYVGSFCSSST